jgi:hypothetical protein
MRWEKLGKIFNPSEHTLPLGCIEFAQSPQAVVFNDFVRIYFSTRQLNEATGKFLSHIAFADFDKQFNKVLQVSDSTVISLGELGTFDEHGIFPMSPLKEENRILAYTCGWSRRVSVSVETSTGLAVSTDGGLTFQKVGKGPVFSSSLHEPFLVGDSFVRKYNGRYHMWYIYGTKWIDTPNEGPARVYKISHATSVDGISWERDNKEIIESVLNENECQALPSVVEYNGKYHMVFCYREATDFRKNPNRGYRIGYAYSADLINWTREKDAGISFSEKGWDANMMCYPHIFECDNNIYLLYNGDEFGRHGFGLAVMR